VQIFFLKRASLYALSKGMRMNIVNTEIMPILLILVEVPTILAKDTVSDMLDENLTIIAHKDLIAI
jgi:hypothetical protein